MTPACATTIGILLQLVGAACLLFFAFGTYKKLSAFRAIVTYDNFSQIIETLACEMGGQYKQQLVGFFFLLVGSAFQLYAAIATSA